MRNRTERSRNLHRFGRSLGSHAWACALAVLVVTLLMLGRIDRVPDLERSVFHSVNDLPGADASGLGFPSGLAAVAAAVMGAALPYLLRRWH